MQVGVLAYWGIGFPVGKPRSEKRGFRVKGLGLRVSNFGLRFGVFLFRGNLWEFGP